ncbi:MAG: hypothetical protein R3240_00010 [Gammaproteobacteria bacterium]|nr:hypothetical protein [Gammaproteobacteria bacterium]
MSATTRVVTKVLAGVQDLLFGVGSVTQSRAGANVTIDKIDMPLPVANIATLQGDTIDPSKFRFALALCHTAANDGGGGPFYWDPTDTTSTDDNGTVLVSTFSGATGRWKRLYTGGKNLKMFGGSGDGVTAVSSQFTSVTSDINIKGKQTGVSYFDTTLAKPVWASGPNASDPWVDATGATVHTPA